MEQERVGTKLVFIFPSKTINVIFPLQNNKAPLQDIIWKWKEKESSIILQPEKPHDCILCPHIYDHRRMKESAVFMMGI